MLLTHVPSPISETVRGPRRTLRLCCGSSAPRSPEMAWGDTAERRATPLVAAGATRVESLGLGFETVCIAESAERPPARGARIASYPCAESGRGIGSRNMEALDLCCVCARAGMRDYARASRSDEIRSRRGRAEAQTRCPAPIPGLSTHGTAVASLAAIFFHLCRVCLNTIPGSGWCPTGEQLCSMCSGLTPTPRPYQSSKF